VVRVDGEPAAATICSLLAKFEQFRDRGFPEASLYVDSTNPTGAVRLYESVGMDVAAEWDRHEFPGAA
jgi:ribosomal protein S18 acetylase RimI-like enzyme